MTDPDKLREIIAGIERRIITALAGNVAARRCLRGREAGWTRHRTPEQSLAFHEAGHLIAAHLLGWPAYFASITARPDIPLGLRHHVGGVVMYTPIEDSAEPWRGRKAPVLDRQTAAREAWSLLALTGGEWPTWRSALRYLRVARFRTAELLEKHWHMVDWFANELMRHKDLSREQIEAIWADLGQPPGSTTK